VVTYRPPPEGWPPRPDVPFTFVTDGLESALEQAKAAGDGGLGVSDADVVQQCLSAGRLDEVRVDLVPVLLCKGIRYCDNIDNTAVTFERLQVVEGVGVTHLRYRVKYLSHVPNGKGEGDE
jgi:dihydrofolate reductase